MLVCWLPLVAILSIWVFAGLNNYRDFQDVMQCFSMFTMPTTVCTKKRCGIKFMVICVSHCPCTVEGFGYDPLLCVLCRGAMDVMQLEGDDNSASASSLLHDAWAAVKRSARHQNISPSWKDVDLGASLGFVSSSLAPSNELLVSTHVSPLPATLGFEATTSSTTAPLPPALLVRVSANVSGPSSSAPPPLTVASSAFFPDSVMVSLMATMKNYIHQEFATGGIRPPVDSAPAPLPTQFSTVSPVEVGLGPAAYSGCLGCRASSSV